MVKKTISYEDFNGDKRTKELRFHLSQTELIELQTSYPGGFLKAIQEAYEAKDKFKIAMFFKDIILKSYGELSEDGDTFRKTKEKTESFEQSAAFDALFMSLIESEKVADDFISAVIPKDLAAKAKQAQVNGQIPQIGSIG